MIWKVISIIAAYLVGAINMATIVGKVKGKNIKKLGSGNPGTMNVLRSVGKGWGALTFAFDSVKGAAFALIGRFAIDGGSKEWMIILGAVCVIGHIFPIYTKFKGGKGVATSLGVFMVSTPIVGTVVLVGLVIYLLLCKIGFIGSYLAITSLCVANCIKYRDSVVSIVLCLVMWTLVIIRHKDNVIRLIKGKENTLSLVGKNTPAELDKHVQEDENGGENSQDGVAFEEKMQNENLDTELSGEENTADSNAEEK